MKGYFIFVSLLFAMIIVLSTFSCSPTGTSEVTIRINLGLNNQNAFNIHEESIIDRIFRFFTKDAEAQAVPEGITDIGLNIAGEGMSAIDESYSAGTSVITINVPAGPARVFQVTAYRPTGNYGGSSEPYDLEAGQSVEIPITMAEQYSSVAINPAYPDGTPASTTLTYTVNVTTSEQTVLSSSFTPGTALQVPAGASKDFEVLVNTPSVTFRGTVLSQNLAAGSSVTLPVDVMLYETKILVPDYNNNRIVQINNGDFNDTTWQADTGWQTNDFGLGTGFYPTDIDFDSRGRIYITEESSQVIRVDDITSLSPSIAITDDYNFASVAIDRNNDFIYVANNSTIRRYNYNGVHDTAFIPPATSLYSIRGLAVDDTGSIYISGQDFSYYGIVLKYTPSTGDESTYNTGTNGEAWDVLVKLNLIYVNNFYFGDHKIVRLNTDFTNPAELLAEPSNASNTLYGPRRFSAILNRKIFLTDDNGSMSARVVSFDDFSDSTWETYGSHGNTSAGEGYFRFWCAC